MPMQKKLCMQKTGYKYTHLQHTHAHTHSLSLSLLTHKKIVREHAIVTRKGAETIEPMRKNDYTPKTGRKLACFCLSQTHTHTSLSPFSVFGIMDI